MLILSESTISNLLLCLTDTQLRLFHDDLSQSFVALSQSSKKIHMPQRTCIKSSTNTMTLIMPTSDETSTSVKTVMVPTSKPIEGAITLFSADGELLALLNAAKLTPFRTALVTMTMLSRTQWSITAKSQSEASTRRYRLLLFGAGRQAEWHLRLALRFSRIGHVTVVNRSKSRLESFNEVFSELLNVYRDITFETLARENCPDYDTRLHGLVSSSDIICSLTPATEILFPYTYLKAPDGTQNSKFVALIGSYQPHMQEVDSDTLFSSEDKKVLVDNVEACLEEAGELIMAETKKEQLVEAGDFVTRTDKEGMNVVKQGTNVVYKCVGTALMDLVVSRTLVRIARDAGKGMVVDEF